MSLFEPGAQVGRYQLLGKLATGGMSEIYLARQSGARGFSKVVVLKVILPHLTGNTEFIRMFINEAKLAALLNHPGIVQIFDFGEERGLPYMAMEYIDGRNLNRIGKALHEKGTKIARPVMLRIIGDTCAALHYAHTLCDAEGQHLKIVHRDISRENILLTYSGQVKLVDFGVAKATILESGTTKGTLKGKYPYMPPEMIRGEEPDQRVDIYALGVVLYGMLLYRAPFAAQNHAQLLDMILHKQPPRPTEVDPTLPAGVEDIVLRAMHKDKEQRFQSALEMQHAVESWVMEHESAVMPFHLSEFMSSTFPTGSDQDRQIYQSLTGATSQPSSPGLAARVTGSISVSSSVSATPAPPRSRRWMVVVALALLAAGGLLAYLAMGPLNRSRVKQKQVEAVVDASPRPGPPASRPAPDQAVRVTAAPDSGSAKAEPKVVAHPTPRRGPASLSVDAPGPGEVLVDGKRIGELPLSKKPVSAGAHRVEVRSAKLGYSVTRQVMVQPGGQQSLHIKPAEGTITVFVHPWGKVTLDGRLLGITPLRPIKALEGPHVLVIENADLKVKQVKRVQVKPGETATVKLILE
jgi:eukaryotic-like serine/threonine-protein kinase